MFGLLRCSIVNQIFYIPAHKKWLVDLPRQEEMVKPRKAKLSIVVPTYNESQNIVRILDSIAETLSPYTAAEDAKTKVLTPLL